MKKQSDIDNYYQSLSEDDKAAVDGWAAWIRKEIDREIIKVICENVRKVK